MMATMVGMDWGMAALGIPATPRKERETVARSEDLAERYGEHAAVSTIWFRVSHGDVASVLGLNDSDLATLAMPGQPRPEVLSQRLDAVMTPAGQVNTAPDHSTPQPLPIHHRTDYVDVFATASSNRPSLPSHSIVPLPPECQTMSCHQYLQRRPEIIRAVHGVTPERDWFLVADIEARPPDYGGEPPSTPPVNDDWLVVPGRRERDIITSRGQDA